MKRYLAIFVVVALASCGRGIEESIQWTDSHVEAAFIHKLKERGIQCTKRYGQIFYLVKDRDEVHKVTAEIDSEYFSNNSILLNRKQDFEKVKSELKKAGIEFSVFTKDDGDWIRWKEHDRLKARAIIRDVTGIPL